MASHGSSVHAVSPLLVAIVLVVVGCSGGDDDSAAASRDLASTSSDEAAETGPPVALTAAELEAALLTSEEVGSGWSTEGAEPLEVGAGEDLGGRCPGGSTFAPPTAAMFVDFEPPDQFPADNTISEGVLTFPTREDLDAWTGALESCVGEQWEESDDPVEHVSLETIDVADLGEESAGFLFHFAHGEDEAPAHDSRWFLVRVEARWCS